MALSTYLISLRTAIRSVTALLITVAIFFCLSVAANAAASSQNVLLVPSATGEGGHGGSLPTSGFAGSYAPSFTNASPADIADGTIADPLSGYDTVVLVQLCSIGDYLGDSDFSSRISAFVSGGGKLIIWDSECAGGQQPDYSQFIYPFQSNNPGAGGNECSGMPVTDCFLHDVESNTLGTDDVSSPYYIDYGAVADDTDAVGDANVFTTRDPAWCVDLVARNVDSKSQAGITGPVQSYAHFGAGLIIFDGLDMDLMNTSGPYDNSSAQQSLSRIFVLSLLQSFAPDNLPCGVVATGITLTPQSATNTLGQNHTVTATLRDEVNNPIIGSTVTFNVIDGPNKGLTGTGVSDANGQASFTYTSSSLGTDQIQASFEAAHICLTISEVCPPDIRMSNVVTKTWVAPATAVVAALDTTKPLARASVSRCRKARRSVTAKVSDASGIASVRFYVDGKRIATDRSAPFSVNISARRLKPGTHRLTIITTDKNGNATRTTKWIDGCGRITRHVSPKFTG